MVADCVLASPFIIGHVGNRTYASSYIPLPALIRLTRYWLRCLPVRVSRSWEDNSLASWRYDPDRRAERKLAVITITSTTTQKGRRGIRHYRC